MHPARLRPSAIPPTPANSSATLTRWLREESEGRADIIRVSRISTSEKKRSPEPRIGHGPTRATWQNRKELPGPRDAYNGRGNSGISVDALFHSRMGAAATTDYRRDHDAFCFLKVVMDISEVPSAVDRVTVEVMG